jgi:hypothetical protein
MPFSDWGVKFRQKCEECGVLFVARTRNAKYCPICSDSAFHNPVDLASYYKAEKELKKAIMASTKAKIYRTKFYKPTKIERPFFKKVDEQFLMELIKK